MALKILQLSSAKSDNFSYLVFCPETLQGMAVDPSFAPEILLQAAAEHGIEIVILANTHGHGDHIAGNPAIIQETGARLAAHPLDVPEADIRLAEGATIPLGQREIEVLHTPGHTPGSVVFKVGAAIITGDTLFISRCGRADLAGSNVTDLYASLQRLKQLPPDTKVYPGHDYGPMPVSTLAWELDNNAFLRCPDLVSFIQLRMG
jgi:glyoxylase-like metal-dependent hydrolase (beta-lactamase superfamily II)